jgi:hypothetical protein
LLDAIGARKGSTKQEMEEGDFQKDENLEKQKKKRN